jgi:hypothetical protein
MVIGRGVAAGAVGTTLLNAATYADMVLRGRPSSDAPKRTVATLLDRAGQDVPGSGDTRENRLEGLAGVSGIATGIGTGVVCSMLRPLLSRLGPGAGGVLAGAMAMAATDVSMARLGVSDPRTWSASYWLSDVVPHLVYGIATVWTLDRM